MDYLVEGEVEIYRFQGGLSCRRRLFFGTIILTNYRLITVTSAIQRNTGYKSEISKKYFQKLSLNKIKKKDTFLAKLDKQKFAESLPQLKKIYQFPITHVIKKKVKKNQFIYEVILKYENKGILKNEPITIRIQPKRDKGEYYSDYKSYYKNVFEKLNATLKME